MPVIGDAPTIGCTAAADVVAAIVVAVVVDIGGGGGGGGSSCGRDVCATAAAAAAVVDVIVDDATAPPIVAAGVAATADGRLGLHDVHGDAGPGGVRDQVCIDGFHLRQAVLKGEGTVCDAGLLFVLAILGGGALEVSQPLAAVAKRGAVPSVWVGGCAEGGVLVAGRILAILFLRAQELCILAIQGQAIILQVLLIKSGCLELILGYISWKTEKKTK